MRPSTAGSVASSTTKLLRKKTVVHRTILLSTKMMNRQCGQCRFLGRISRWRLRTRHPSVDQKCTRAINRLAHRSGVNCWRDPPTIVTRYNHAISTAPSRRVNEISISRPRSFKYFLSSGLSPECGQSCLEFALGRLEGVQIIHRAYDDGKYDCDPIDFRFEEFSIPMIARH